MSVFPETSSEFGTRVNRRLQGHRTIWLTSVGQDGTPQPNPVWFLWQDDGILVYNKRDANRLAHVRERPRVSMNLDGDGYGSNIVVLAGTAEILPEHPGPHEHEAYLRKYADNMARISGSAASFGAEYPVALRIVVSRVRGY
jgi:PPOX class probable F420-dependent enzyme